jgi:hypothetical protein
VEHEVWSGHPATVYSAWQWVLVVVTLGIAYLVLWIKSRTITFRITSQRVQVERGLFSTLKDNVELFTIEHFDIHKPLGMRLAGYCKLISGRPTTTPRRSCSTASPIWKRWPTRCARARCANARAVV